MYSLNLIQKTIFYCLSNRFHHKHKLLILSSRTGVVSLTNLGGGGGGLDDGGGMSHGPDGGSLGGNLRAGGALGGAKNMLYNTINHSF